MRYLKPLVAVAALAFAAPGVSQTAPVTAKPAMWRVSDPDTTVYLFGTIHLLPKGTQWHSAPVDKAIASSNELVIETILDEKNPAAAMGEMMRLGVSPNLPPLAQRIPASKQARLAELLKSIGAPASAFDKFETWTAALVLLGPQLIEFGMDPSLGVEHNLRATFSKAGKPIGQLETNAEQFGFFDTLPEAAQRKFLEGVLDDPAKARKTMDGMVRSWATGDMKAMEKTFNDEMKDSPALKEALLVRRNANWTRWIANRMAKPGTVMVAVGAGHLVGDASVVRMLQKRGMKVTRVQ